MIPFKYCIDYLLIETSDSLLFGELRRVLDRVSEEVVDLLEAEVLAIIICLRHFFNYLLYSPYFRINHSLQ